MGLSLRDIGGAFLGGGSMGASLLGLGSAGGSQQPSQTTGLPAWLQPYAQQYIGRAAELSNQPFQAYSGQTNAAINPLQQQAIDMTAARAQAGSDINRAAGGELASTLRGDYLKQGNPYLTGMIDQASQDVTRNFQSAVLPSLDNLAARSGSFGNTGVDQVRGDAFRGLGQQLGNIATTMRGQDYANERNRMQQAVSMAPTIANQDYFDASQLGIAGDAMQGQQQRALDDARMRFEEQRTGPQQQLGILGSALQGNYGMTTTQNQGRGSLAQGALGGAAAGSAFGPWGAAIGGGMGALGEPEVMGLLDYLQNPQSNPALQQGLLQFGLNLMGQRGGNLLQNVGQAGLSGLAGYQQTQDQMRQRSIQDQQLEFQRAQQEAWRKAQEQAEADRIAQAQALKAATIPGTESTAANPYAIDYENSMDSGGAVNFKPAGIDMQRYASALAAAGSPMAIPAFQSLQKAEPELKAFDPSHDIWRGGTLVRPGSPKPNDQPSAVREYMFAQSQGYKGSFDQWDRDRRKAGATNVTTKVETKTGESMAGQIGPMLRESREKAVSGMKMVESAGRILSAIDRGNVIAGPMANARLLVAQAVDTFGFGGKDTAEKLENTRTVIRGMAEQAVQARSQLGGQAQISDSEQKLLSRATSGDIADMTVGEIRQIAELNQRLGSQLYESHAAQMEEVKNDPNLSGLTRFYAVPPLPKQRQATRPQSQPQGIPDAAAIDAEIARRRGGR